MKNIVFNRLHLGLALSLMLPVLSCTRLPDTAQDVLHPQDKIEQPTDSKDTYILGMLRVKLTEGLYRSLNAQQLRSGNDQVDSYLSNIQALKMVPVFRNLDPEFSERHRKAGLHLWYDIEFSESVEVLQAMRGANGLPGIQEVEAIEQIAPSGGKVVFGMPNSFRSTPQAGDGIPNDERFRDQWNLYNTGQIDGFRKGVDVNVVEAWKAGVTGDSRVIVAVLDGGVQVNHPDLIDNLWVNPKAKADAHGVMDTHGQNFIDEVHTIDPDNHGTHVAGLIAATRNNGKGIAGVAGGDGTKGSGVRIMSCQIFAEKNNSSAVLNAFIYAADNGAVLANNSWGTGGGSGPDMIPGSFKTAIDYFTDHAGCDKDGNQRSDSPMKGGLALFAAGNNGGEMWYIPANYSRVVAVTSVGPTAKKAVYSNYGVWADISAPGGDYDYGNPEGLTLSTITEGMYGYMQGTSQATPIATGVAALIVSKFGGKGFTNKQLREKLESALRPFDLNKINPKYVGKIGVGIVDAGRAIADSKQSNPEAVSRETLKITPSQNQVALQWQAVKDLDDGSADYYKLYYSDQGALSETSLETAKYMKINALEYKAGETIEFAATGLKLNTTYHFALVAIDRWGLTSETLFFESTTLKNHRPTLSIVSGESNPTLRDSNKTIVEVSVQDADGHEWSYELRGETRGITHYRSRDKIIIEMRKTLEQGKYLVQVVVSDPFETSTLDIPFEVGANHAPTTTAEIGEIFIPITKKDFYLDLSTLFHDADGDELTYQARSMNPEIATPKIDDGKLTLDITQKGNARLETTARDPLGGLVRLNFIARIVNDDIVYVAYPVPVSTDLNIRLSDEVYFAEIRIVTSLGAQKMVKFVTVREDSDRHVKLDMSKIEVGSYVLEVSANGKVFKQNIVKN